MLLLRGSCDHPVAPRNTDSLAGTIITICCPLGPAAPHIQLIDIIMIDIVNDRRSL